MAASISANFLLFPFPLASSSPFNSTSASKFIIENLKGEIAVATQHVGEKDYKTMLQEKLQVHGKVKITYKIVKETGPDHNKNFEAEVE